MNERFALSGLLIFLTCSILIIIVNRSGKGRLHKVWILFNFAVAIWGAGAFFIGNSRTSTEAFLWWKIAHIGIILIPVFMYHMVSILCNIRQKKLLFLIYIQGLIFLVVNIINPYNMFLSGTRLLLSSLYYGTLGPIYHPFFIIWLSIIFYSHYELSLSYLRLLGIKKTRITYLFFATFVGFLGGLTNFITAYGADIFPYGNFTIPLYCIIVTYAILRYRLMDIYLAIKRTAAYSLAAGLLTAVFAILVITATNLFSTFAGASSLKISVAAALIIALLFNPLRNRIQTLIDKVFYKKTYDYYGTIQRVSSTLASMFDSNKIFQFVANVLDEAMGLRDVYLLASTPGGSFDVVYQMSSEKDKDIKQKEELEKHSVTKEINLTEVSKLFKSSCEVVLKDELSRIEELHGQDLADRIKKEFDVFHGEVVVPIFLDKKLSFLLILGEKLSGDIFTDEDINLLNTISVQTAIAVKNARMYQEKVNAEKLATLGMMSGTFAHEIRNPLTSLKTFAQLMPEKYNDVEFRDTFSKIVVGEIEKIDGLISDLLDFSSGKKPSAINNFNLTELVDGIVDYVQGKLKFEKSKITVEKHYNGEAIEMTGDARKLKQAFSNIIINGCQAMSNEGILRVDIKPNGKYFDVIVEDTGRGIQPENLAKIFDPFITTKERGIGLGLAISKTVVEAHDGKIHVKSQPEKGTTFTISLPLQNE